MAQFISDESLNTYPLDEVNINNDDPKVYKLKWPPFQNSSYLQRVANNDQAVKFDRNINRIEYPLIQAALIIVGKKYPASGISTDESINFTSTRFTQRLEQDILTFKSYFQLDISSNEDINSQFIKTLDDVLFRIKDFFVIFHGDASYEFSQIPPNHASVDFKTFINRNKLDYKTGNVPKEIETDIVSEILFLKSLDGGNKIAAEFKYRETEVAVASERFSHGIIKSNVVRIPVNQFTIDGDSVTHADQLINEAITTPPTKIISLENGYMHTVKQGETAVSIINQYYYSGLYPAKAENIDTGELIFDFPTPTMSPTDQRHHDARLKFYLRFIYALNIEVETDISGSVIEYGLSNQGGFQVDEDFIDAFCMFDNVFVPGDANSIMPNYYRFLEQEKLNNSFADITFDGQGECTTYTANVGNKLFIPKREMVDSMYYHLNYRHKDYLYPDSTGEEMLVIPNIQTFIDNIESESTWSQLTSWLQDEITELYTKSFEFFDKMYDFGIGGLSDIFPRGLGASLNASLGITWGYPVYTDFTSQKYLYRKLTGLDECVIMMREEGTIEVGVQTGLLFSAGLYSGSGKKKKGIGIKAGGSIKAGAKMEVLNEYEFPVRREETALLACLISFSSAVSSITEILGLFSAINFNPRSYLTKSRFGLGSEISGEAAAELGLAANQDKNTGQNAAFNKPDNSNSSSSQLGLDKIFDYIPAIEVNGSINTGIEYEWSAKYAKNPYVPETDVREPSEVSFKFAYMLHGDFNFEFVKGNFLARILLNFGLSPLTNLLSFDVGVTLGCQFKYKREINADQVTSNYVNLNAYLDNVQDNITPANLDTLVGFTDGMLIIKDTPYQILPFFGTYSGDVNKIAVAGTEGTLSINPYQAYKFFNEKNENFTLADIPEMLKIFYSYQARYKMGPSRFVKKGKFVKNMLDKFNENKALLEDSITDLVDKINSSGNSIFIQGGLAVDVGFEIVFNEVLDLLEYLFKRQYGVIQIFFGSEDGQRDRNRFLSRINKVRNNIINDWNTNHTGSEKEKFVFINNKLKTIFTEPNNYNNNLALYTEYNVPEITDVNLAQVFEVFVNIYGEFQRYFEFFSNDKDEKELLQNLTSKTTILINDDEQEHISDNELLDYTISSLQAVASIVNLSSRLECKLGFEVGAKYAAALEAIMLRFDLSIGAHVIYVPAFVEEGNFVDFSNGDDPYATFFNKIKNLYDFNTNNIEPNTLKESINIKELNE